MTTAPIWEGCNYQNENFQIGSLIKGRGTVIFLRPLSALIQAMYCRVPHKHFHPTRLSGASLGWEHTQGARGWETLHPTQHMGESWPKSKFQTGKGKHEKRENGEKSQS